MPNWIEGTMRIRGAEKDVFKFMINAFVKLELKKDAEGFSTYQEVGSGAKFAYSEIEIENGCYIKGTRRAFVNGEAWAYFESDKPEESDAEMIGVVTIKQAWGWVEENWKELSDKYNVDLKLIGWERGMEYKGECTVLRGQDPVYNEVEYDNWDWDSECPLLGG